MAPFCRIAAPSAKAATRSFGPWRSTRIAIGCFSSRSIVRMTSIFSGSFSRGRWLMLRRKTSAPARNSFSIISGVSEAGPRVAMIFVRRERFKAVSIPRVGSAGFETTGS